jgi:hypothetical protein
LFARKQAPVSIAVSQAAPVANLDTKRFLFLVQLKSFLQPAPGLSRSTPGCRSSLQAVLVAELSAERFLFLLQRHGFLQPAPGLQDHRLVAVAPLQAVLVAELQAERFYSECFLGLVKVCGRINTD